jgi:hypothetical protein
MSIELEKKIDEILFEVKNTAKRVGVIDYHKTYLTHCCKEISVDGLWLEFGVYRGRSITAISEFTKNIVYGFDSFEGLPEFWDQQNPKGVFNLGGIIPEGAICGNNDDNPGMYNSSPTKTTQPWRPNIKLIKGYFENTLPEFLNDHTEKVAFVHIDSDIYSSARTVLTLLKDRFQNNTILAFDELTDYPDFRNHEIKAFAEFLLETGYKYEAIFHQCLGQYTQSCFKILLS